MNICVSDIGSFSNSEKHSYISVFLRENSVSHLFRHEYINYKVFLFVHKQSPVIY
ncbi:hypothetical protein FM106_31505 [Brachybacterium faecium]|nr:hypothetical protein FM106_31505 [Brachybacterium faecium]